MTITMAITFNNSNSYYYCHCCCRLLDMWFKKEKKLKLRIAYVISRIFDPFWWLAAWGVLIVFLDDFEGYNRVWWAVGMAMFLGILPIIALWLGLIKGKVSDIDFTDRKERTPYILVILFFWFLGLILGWAFRAPALAMYILLVVIIMGVLVLVINFYWKISVHSIGVTAGCFLLNELFCNWQAGWLFVLMPIVVWSRWVQKKHTLTQLLAGVVLGGAAWGLLRVFGY